MIDDDYAGNRYAYAVEFMKASDTIRMLALAGRQPSLAEAQHCTESRQLFELYTAINSVLAVNYITPTSTAKESTP